MSEPIDPPAAETAAAARERFEQLCTRLEEQKSLRQELRSTYTDLYDAEILVITAMKTKLDMEKEG
jgi:hypothetical protein